MLEVGDLAPSFQLPVVPGETLSSSDLLGKRYVLYFYPADDTPGCTKEACGIRDLLPRFQTGAVAVFGVSPQGVESHRAFIAKYGLNFPLVADEAHALAEAFGAWGEKNLYGNVVVGILRSTFVIAPDGKIEKVWPKVNPEGHAEEILAYLEGGAAAAPAAPAPAAPAPAAAPKPKPAAKKAKKPAAKKAAPKAKAPARPAPKKKVAKASAPKKGSPAKAAPKRKAAKKVVKKAAKKAAKKAVRKAAKPVAKKKVAKKVVKKVAKKVVRKASKPAAKKKPMAKKAGRKATKRPAKKGAKRR